MFTLLTSATALLALSSALSGAQARCVPKKNIDLTPSQGSGNSSSKFIAKGYYTGWNSDDFPPENVSWSKYTHMTYAFAMPTDNGTLTLEGSDPKGLEPFVKAAHENDVKVSISVGGWTGSRFISNLVATPENRTAFVETLTDFAVQYKLDGLDIDWEYPNRQGLGCNTISPNDTANFVLLLQELRAHPAAANLSLSAAVSLAVFNDATGNPATNITGLGEVLDHLVIMNYDVWGSWSSSVGPNAPLNDTCAAPANQQGSAVWSMQKWNQAGVPLNKIVLGVAAYAHSFSVNTTDAFVNGSTTELAAYPPFNKGVHPVGDKWDDPEGAVDLCGVTNHAGGIYTFWGLIEAGFLKEDGSPNKPYRFDNCSRTAYAYDAEKEVMVSFDDPQAFADKGSFITSSGLGGFSVWHAGGDKGTILLDAIRGGAGL